MANFRNALLLTTTCVALALSTSAFAQTADETAAAPVAVEKTAHKTAHKAKHKAHKAKKAAAAKADASK